MRTRLLAAVAAATALATAPAYGATDRPQIRDVKGDAVTGAAELDIVSARWSTSGSGPDRNLVATMTLAAPPKQEVPYVYELSVDVRGCGTMLFRYMPGSAASFANTKPGEIWVECPSRIYDTVIGLTVTGNSITWSIPISVLPPEIGPGAVFSEFEALADVGEPGFGHSVTGVAGHALDVAWGDGTWRMR